MDVLKKVKAATLIETLTASVLIIIVFMVASLSFNNIFTNHTKRDRGVIENRVKELQYLLIHEQIQLPYVEDFGNWEIEMTKSDKSVDILVGAEGQSLLQKKLWIGE